jgi:hypothetical protein
LELGELLDAAIERQREPAVQWSQDVEIGLLGDLGTIAADNIETRLDDLGMRLSDRSPSELVDRLLSLLEATESSRLLEDALGGGSHAAALQSEEVRPHSTTGHVDGPLKDLRKVIAPPTDPDVVDGALRLVVELARALVKGADGVSVSLLRHGRLSTVAASDQTIMDMDTDQYATGEGPCVDASLTGHVFHAPVLAGESRWPAFTPQALDLGINAILSSPLKAFEKPVGALNIYSRRPLAFDADDQAIAATFANKASVILSDAGAGNTDVQIAQRYQQALRGREVITLAKGMIMEREGLGEDDAFAALLRLSLYSGVSLRTRSEAMVLSAQQSRQASEWDLDA